MDNALKYVDEADKAYGLAGMAIALVAWNAEEWLESINLDAAPEEAMHMSAEYYLLTAPRVGAKAVWEQALKRYRIVAAMTVANVTCREMVLRRRGISSAIDTAMRSLLLEEGDALCGLESDEVGRVYNKSYGYCRQLFGHPGVCQLARQFADAIASRKVMSAAEVFELLAPLSRM